jgi:hypothetical protein
LAGFLRLFVWPEWPAGLPEAPSFFLIFSSFFFGWLCVDGLYVCCSLFFVPI